MITKSLFVPAIALLVSVTPLAGAAEPNESAERASIKTFVRTFLLAFESLDMQQFVACFADDATVFFPLPEPPERVEGKQAIQ
jgi:ketosteroid isomerase-like protein